MDGSEKVYGIPPEQIIGSSIVTKFEIRDGRPVLVREPRLDFIDDHEGKPVAINKFTDNQLPITDYRSPITIFMYD